MKKLITKLLFLICFLFGLQTTSAQDVSISGTVTSKEGEPLPGVNVLVKGSSLGTQTDFDGKYTIKTAKGTVLVFSYVGLIKQSITVGNASVINVSMEEDENTLNEVVVTALGIKRSKKALAYAVTEIKGESLTKSRATNVGNSLAGKVAGVSVNAPATGPGGSTKIIIRGNSSLTKSNQPLYVIDGIPINNQVLGSAGQWGGSDKGDGISNVNPDDIETMTVLKGANATALYGNRGVNGVILITTKSGTNINGIGVEINSNFVMDKIVSDQDHQLVYGQGINGRKYTSADELLGTPDGGMLSWGGKLDGSQAVQFDGVMRPYQNVGNAQELFYRAGSTFSNTVSLTGGNEKSNFRFSLGDTDNKSVMPNSSFKKNNYSIKVNSKFSDKFSAGMGATYIRQKTNNAIRVSDFPMNANTGIANFPANVHPDLAKGETGKLGAGLDGRELNVHGTVWWSNPYWAAYQAERFDEKERLMANTSLRYEVNDWIYVQGRMGIDSQTVEQTDGSPQGQGYGAGNGDISHTTNRFQEENIDLIVGFDKEINENFRVNGLIGGNQMRQKIRSKSISGNTFDIPFWEVYANTKNRSAGMGFTAQAVNSLFYSAEISYKNYLYLTTTGREDWFSTLDGRSQFYPSVGLSGIVSDMFELPESITFFKVSSSYGKSSGAGDPYSLNSSYSLGNPHIGNSVGSIAQGKIPNANLIPFLTSEFEVGLDIRMFQNRFGIDLTYYSKTTTDDILNATVSVASGYGSKVVNVGEISNKGLELLISGTPIRNDDFSWDVSFNLGYNKNLVKSLLDPQNDNEFLSVEQSRQLHAFVRHYEGMPYSQVSGYKYLRNDSGVIQLDDAGLPLRDDAAGIVPFGTGYAPYNGGLQNSFKYKNFDLAFSIDYRFGGYMHSGTNARAYMYGLHKNTLVGRETGIGSVSAENVQEYYRRIGADITEEFVYKSDFVKLREISIGYSLPSKYIEKLNVASLNLSLVGRNLFTLYKDIPNVDPESGYHVGNGQGLEFFPVPRIRSVGLNLNVKF